MSLRHIDGCESEFDRALLVAPRNIVRLDTVVKLSFDFMRLQVFVGILASDGLPLLGIFADLYFHALLARKVYWENALRKMLGKNATQVFLDCIRCVLSVESIRADQVRQPETVGHCG